MVAATALASAAMAANRNTRSGWRNSALRSVKRTTSQAAHRPSSVLPVAMPSAVGSDSSTEKLAIAAPSHTPGQARKPQISSAASAIPEGGQTAVA